MTFRQWVDCHRVPFVTGSDGLTWRQRGIRARAYAERIRMSPADIARIRARLAQREEPPASSE